jgi:hypothetical protein
MSHSLYCQLEVLCKVLLHKFKKGPQKPIQTGQKQDVDWNSGHIQVAALHDTYNLKIEGTN